MHGLRRSPTLKSRLSGPFTEWLSRPDKVLKGWLAKKIVDFPDV